MLRSFIVHVMLIATSAVIALFVVKVFDDWHQDTQERRRRRAEHSTRRYE